MPTRNVVLTERQAEMVEELVESGRYQNASEVLREGLRLLEERDAENAAKLKVLREAARKGMADIEAGRYVAFDSSKSLRAHLEKRAQKVLGRRRK
jgi:antitoxin ParD1/3/4